MLCSWSETFAYLNTCWTWRTMVASFVDIITQMNFTCISIKINIQKFKFKTSFVFTNVIWCQYSESCWPFFLLFSLLFFIQDILLIIFFLVSKSFEKCIRHFHFHFWPCSVYFNKAYTYLIRASQNNFIIFMW